MGKKTNRFFWNNNLWWLEHWYGISVSDKTYCAHDFIESNGRIFFKVRLSSLIGSSKEGLDDLNEVYVDDRLRAADANDWAIGFVKPMSSKATIIEILSADIYDTGHPTISVHSDGIAWIDSCDDINEHETIRIACASSRYLEDYRVEYRDISIDRSLVTDLKPTMILIEDTEQNGVPEGYIFFADRKGNDKKHFMYSIDKDGSLTFVTDVDTLYGYNEETVYLESGGQLVSINRRSGETKNLNGIIQEILRLKVYGENPISNKLTDLMAYFDTGRDELFFYEQQGLKHPGKCALIGISIKKSGSEYNVSKERVECPEVSANKQNPVIFDGSRYVWRITNLWSGYKIFRKDGSLRGKFLVNEEDEAAKSTMVFSTPSCVFVEWSQIKNPQDIRLSYTTNKGLCRMFAVVPDERCLEVIPPEDEDRV